MERRYKLIIEYDRVAKVNILRGIHCLECDTPCRHIETRKDGDWQTFRYTCPCCGQDYAHAMYITLGD